jgi:hypothetical protein
MRYPGVAVLSSWQHPANLGVDIRLLGCTITVESKRGRKAAKVDGSEDLLKGGGDP